MPKRAMFPGFSKRTAAASALLYAPATAVLGAGGDGVSPKAYTLSQGAFTNSIVTSWVFSLLLILLIRKMVGKPKLVPSKGQAVVEDLILGIREIMAPIVGKRMIKRVFPLLICFFTFILIHNWSGLIPGVGAFGLQRGGGAEVAVEVDLDGSIRDLRVVSGGEGYDGHYPPDILVKGAGQGASAHAVIEHGQVVDVVLDDPGSGYDTDVAAELKHKIRYWFRPGNADLNMTVALALISFGAWFYFVFKFTPVKTVAFDLFGNKADKTEVPLPLYLVLFVVFFGVGLIEIVSIIFRPISLSFRLYGNMYGGENLLTSMLGLVGYLVPVPFYFLELLIGFVQALVFTLLTAVYIGLICNHDEAEHAH